MRSLWRGWPASAHHAAAYEAAKAKMLDMLTPLGCKK